MKWHHANVGVACLSAEEVHTPPGSLQNKLPPLKIIKNNKRKYQESFWKSPEILGSREKSQNLCAARIFQYKHNAKRINSFGLMV